MISGPNSNAEEKAQEVSSFGFGLPLFCVFIIQVRYIEAAKWNIVSAETSAVTVEGPGGGHLPAILTNFRAADEITRLFEKRCATSDFARTTTVTFSTSYRCPTYAEVEV